MVINVFNVVCNNVMYSDFNTILEDINISFSNNKLVFDNFKNLETSIWFDDTKINADYITFILAKDINIELAEDKEEFNLIEYEKEKKVPKIVSHCIYVKSKKILLMEVSSNSSNEKCLKRGILKELSLNSDDIEFRQVKRNNIEQRLSSFVNNINKIELSASNLTSVIKEPDENGEIFKLISDNNCKIKLSLNIDKNNISIKEVILKLFKKEYKDKSDYIDNIRIQCLNDFEEKEIIQLTENFLNLNIKADELKKHKNFTSRLEYSFLRYQNMIKAYENNL